LKPFYIIFDILSTTNTKYLKNVPSRQIATELGVYNATVSRNRKQKEEAGELLHCNTSTGADGKEYPRLAPCKGS